MGDEQLTALEKRIQDIEYEKLLRPLEVRIQGFENKLWVATAIAIIFGAAGSWGVLTLSEAKTQLDALKEGIPKIESARKIALEEINQRKDTQIAEFNRLAGEIARRAVTGEVQGQISAVKKWTAFIYSNADTYKEGPFASGYWQKVLHDQNATVQQELK